MLTVKIIDEATQKPLKGYAVFITTKKGKIRKKLYHNSTGALTDKNGMANMLYVSPDGAYITIIGCGYPNKTILLVPHLTNYDRKLKKFIAEVEL